MAVWWYMHKIIKWFSAALIWLWQSHQLSS